MSLGLGVPSSAHCWPRLDLRCERARQTRQAKSGAESRESSVGPSKAQLAARETFAGFHEGAVEALGGTLSALSTRCRSPSTPGGTGRWPKRAQRLSVWGTDAGLTYDQAFSQNMGNTKKPWPLATRTLMAQLEEEFEGYRHSSERKTPNAAAAKAAEDAAAKLPPPGRRPCRRR